MRISELFRGPPARVLWFCWLGWAFDFFDLILFAFVKVDVQHDLQLDLAAIAWIDGWTLGASAVGGFAFGHIADRLGRRPALSASILVYSAGALATGLADGFGSLLAARIVTGIGVGGEWGVGHAAVAEAYPESQRSRAAGLLQAATPFGMGGGRARRLLRRATDRLARVLSARGPAGPAGVLRALRDAA